MTEGVLLPQTYLPNVDISSSHSIAIRISSRVTAKEDRKQYLLKKLMKGLREWLAFPGQHSLLGAYFVIHLLRVCDNIDILLLPGVWKAHCHVKTRILMSGHIRTTSLSPSNLLPFAERLATSPLAYKDSQERSVLDSISGVLKDVIPLLSSTSLALVHNIQEATLLDDLSRGHAPPVSDTMKQQGRHKLLALIRILLPLINTPHPSVLTPLQKKVAGDQDYYMPFREHAPSRLRVTAPGGPFHSDHRTLPGAFPSWVIFRTLLFKSPMLQNNTQGFFSSLQSWEELLHRLNFDPEGPPITHRYFYDLRCYGSPQGKRRAAFCSEVHVYFNHEEKWTTLKQQWPGKIPFFVFLNWSRDLKLPQLGKLTSYLLTSDLVYADIVQPPTSKELAKALWTMDFGAKRGLVLLGQTSSATCSEHELVHAFVDLYEWLDRELSLEEKALMIYDPIMLEHLLCKYQRIYK